MWNPLYVLILSYLSATSWAYDPIQAPKQKDDEFNKHGYFKDYIPIETDIELICQEFHLLNFKDFREMLTLTLIQDQQGGRQTVAYVDDNDDYNKKSDNETGPAGRLWRYLNFGEDTSDRLKIPTDFNIHRWVNKGIFSKGDENWKQPFVGRNLPLIVDFSEGYLKFKKDEKKKINDQRPTHPNERFLYSISQVGEMPFHEMDDENLINEIIHLLNDLKLTPRSVTNKAFFNEIGGKRVSNYFDRVKTGTKLKAIKKKKNGEVGVEVLLLDMRGVNNTIEQAGELTEEQAGELTEEQAGRLNAIMNKEQINKQDSEFVEKLQKQKKDIFTTDYLLMYLWFVIEFGNSIASITAQLEPHWSIYSKVDETTKQATYYNHVGVSLRIVDQSDINMSPSIPKIEPLSIFETKPEHKVNVSVNGTA